MGYKRFSFSEKEIDNIRYELYHEIPNNPHEWIYYFRDNTLFIREDHPLTTVYLLKYV